MWLFSTVMADFKFQNWQVKIYTKNLKKVWKKTKKSQILKIMMNTFNSEYTKLLIKLNKNIKILPLELIKLDLVK